ncbi:MAG: CBS domain-containing protein, partial [Gemmatimonadales bacterium]
SRQVKLPDQDGYPVVEDDGTLVGMLTLAEIARFTREDQANDTMRTCGEVAQRVRALAPNDTLLSGMRRMAVRGASSLPVADPSTAKIFGLLSRSHALWLYERVMVETGSHPVVKGTGNREQGTGSRE